jgi:hypothetical protein
MADFLFLMHNDSPRALLTEDDGAWDPYLQNLVALGCFRGGSAIGKGTCFKKAGSPVPVTERIVGFIQVSALDIDDAAKLLPGNPVFEAGGTVEIREL